MIFLLILLLFVSVLSVVVVATVGGIGWIITTVFSDNGLWVSAAFLVIGLVLVALGSYMQRSEQRG